MKGLEEQDSAEDTRELSLSGHFQILVLWAAHVYPQSSHSSLGLPIVPCCYVSCDSCSLIILSQKPYEAEFYCVQ